jgi:hypothetical protein
MRRRALLLSLVSPLALAQGDEFAGLKRHGSATMSFFGLRIYDIRLWAAERPDAARWAEQRLALELEYARALSGSEIAKRSFAEMRRQGEIAEAQATAWLAEMQAAFPDVKAGDRITGLHEPGSGAHFFLNGQPRRVVADARFAKFFFGIWLSPQTSEPKLRAALLATDASR